MSNLIVVDGDFLVQILKNLNNDVPDPILEVRSLQTNRYAIFRTYLDFLRAGAKIIRTNTGRVTLSPLMTHLGIDGAEITSLIMTSVELAQKAVYRYYEETGGDTSNTEEFKKNRPLIAGYCGSYGIVRAEHGARPNYWDYTGRYELLRCHRMRMQTLLNTGVDLLAIEGIPSKIEAQIIVDLMRQFRTARMWITFMCHNELELIDGNSFIDVARYVYNSLPGQVIAIGGVCSDMNTQMNLIEEVRSKFTADHLPMITYFDEGNELKHRAASHWVRECMNFDVLYISGKPGSNAEDIKIIHDAVNTQVSQLYDFAGPSYATFNNTCSSRNEEIKSKI